MFFDKLFCSQDELCLGLDGVKDRRCLREERADLLENADAGAGHVDADVLEVVAAHKFPDAFGLPEVGLVEPFVACDQLYAPPSLSGGATMTKLASSRLRDGS